MKLFSRNIISTIVFAVTAITDAAPENKEVDWLLGFRDPNARTTSVDAGTVLNFSWEGYHDVQKFPSKQAFDSCDFSDVTSIGDASPVTYTVTETTYFSCSVSGHCPAGQKLEAIVSTTDATDAAPESPSVVGIAVGNDSFSTLVSLLQKAELVDLLSGSGPFTVFAPSNEAFAALPKSAVAWLTADENKDALVKVLKYHVVSGNVMSSDLVAGDVTTVEGQSVTVSLTPVMINTAKVVNADIGASNGVVHVIDSVLIPDGVLPVEDTNEEEMTAESPIEPTNDSMEMESSGCFTGIIGNFMLLSGVFFWSVTTVLC